jgi:hypothetical protein
MKINLPKSDLEKYKRGVETIDMFLESRLASDALRMAQQCDKTVNEAHLEHFKDNLLVFKEFLEKAEVESERKKQLNAERKEKGDGNGKENNFTKERISNPLIREIYYMTNPSTIERETLLFDQIEKTCFTDAGRLLDMYYKRFNIKNEDGSLSLDPFLKRACPKTFEPFSDRVPKGEMKSIRMKSRREIVNGDHDKDNDSYKKFLDPKIEHPFGTPYNIEKEE